MYESKYSPQLKQIKENTAMTTDIKSFKIIVLQENFDQHI